MKSARGRCLLGAPRPSRGACRPMMARANVVFPDPDSPTSARHSRSWSCSETPCRTCRAPWNASTSLTSSRQAAAGGVSRAGNAVIAEAPISATRMQRAPCAGPISTSGGGSAVHAGSTYSQRGAKTHPSGRAPGGGTRPGIASSSRRLAMSGIAPISLRVYGCAGASKSSLVGASLDDASGVHHEHALRQRRDGREIVADVDGGCLVAQAELAHRREHVRLRRDVEPGRRLVEDDQGGPQEERDGQADALLLAARELVRIALQEVACRREPDLAECVHDACADVAPLAVLAHDLLELGPDPQRRVEGRGRVLRNVGDELSPGAPERLAAQVRARPSRRCGPSRRRCASRAWRARAGRPRPSSCRSPTRRPARRSRRARGRTRCRRRSRGRWPQAPRAAR